MKKFLLICLLVGLFSMCTSCSSEEHHHSYSKWEITEKPTCTENGTREKKCTICGDVIKEEIPATGHNFVNGECTECGKKQSESEK